jgi:DNA-binding LacI/PurR family transcriptional regulator
MRKATKNRGAMPIRSTLTDQTTEFIHRGLNARRWEKLMPTENELCHELGVSRGTLRNALAPLFEEDLLRPGGRGGRHKIVERSKKTPKHAVAALKGDLVKVLSPQPRYVITGQTPMILQTMTEALGRIGLHLEFECHPGLWNSRRPDSLLRRITAQPKTVGWVLYRSTQAVQQWFEASGIPTVVLGGVYPGISLPRAQFDLVAASRHAAGIFIARGHRTMVFLTVENSTAGDISCANEFVATAAASGANAAIVTYDDTVADLCHKLDGLLVSSRVPSAFFVAFPNHVSATIGHLARRGFPVPGSALVISRMDARLLAENIPSVARYQVDAEALGRGATQLLRQILTPGTTRFAGEYTVMPEFVDGETAGGRPNY